MMVRLVRAIETKAKKKYELYVGINHLPTNVFLVQSPFFLSLPKKKL